MDFQSYRTTSKLDLHGTILKIPIRKFWLIFYIGGTMVILTLLSTDWTDVTSILAHIFSVPALFIALFLSAKFLYQEDAVRLAAKYRFYTKTRKYEMNSNLFKKKCINNKIK